MKNLCLATFSLVLNGKRTSINGMIDPVLYVFSKRIDEIIILDGSHPGSSNVNTIFEIHKHGRLATKKISLSSTLLSPLLSSQKTNGTSLLFKLRDFLSVIELGLGRKERIEIFIGLESVYAIGGMILKKLGKIKKVIYYVSDYSPKRYNNKTLNDIYLWLDRFCCYHADFIWDVSPAMITARETAGLKKTRCRPVILVRNGLFPKQLTFFPISKRVPFSIVFAGTFGLENGTKLLIEAMKLVSKEIPGATLHFYGGNKDQEDYLQSLVVKFKLTKHVFFHGLITNAEKLSKIISQYQIGVAPYVAIDGSPRLYADATKIRLYLGCGLPVITTQVPPLGKEVEEKGAAIVVRDEATQIAHAITNLMSDDKKYHDMAQSAMAFAKTNTWEKAYNDAFEKMEIKI